jgi:uncharacterized membrane protein
MRMHLGHAQYLPVAPPMFALLAGALAMVRVLRFAYMQLGVSSGTAFFLLLGSLLGSYVNIPIATLGEEAMVSEREVTYSVCITSCRSWSNRQTAGEEAR